MGLSVWVPSVLSATRDSLSGKSHHLRGQVSKQWLASVNRPEPQRECIQRHRSHVEDLVSGGGTAKGHQNGQKQGPAPAEDCVPICVQSKAAAASNE